QRLPDSKIKNVLLTHLMVANGDFDAFRKHIANWFDDSMERLSGPYKRHMKLLSFVIGLIVAIVFNADTFSAGNALWSSPALSDQMRIVAEKQIERKPTDDTETIGKAFQEAQDVLRPMLPLGWSFEGPWKDLKWWEKLWNKLKLEELLLHFFGW